MRFQIAVLYLTVGLLAPIAAHANPINPDVTFYLYNATTQYGGSEYGSVTINTVNGTVVSEDIFIDSVFLPEVQRSFNYVFRGAPGSQGPDGNAYGATLFGSVAGSDYDLELEGTSLVGYTGGNLCTIVDISSCGGSLSSLYTGNFDENIANQTGGYLSPIDPTPEPSSFLLLATGMAGVATTVCRRAFRQK